MDIIEKIKQEFGYDGKPKQWQQGFDALLRHLPDIIKENEFADLKDFAQSQQKSCHRIKELLNVEVPVIKKHLEAHKWFRHIPDESKGMIDFIEQYGWIMKDIFCSVCPDKNTCTHSSTG